MAGTKTGLQGLAGTETPDVIPRAPPSSDPGHPEFKVQSVGSRFRFGGGLAVWRVPTPPYQNKRPNRETPTEPEPLFLVRGGWYPPQRHATRLTLLRSQAANAKSPARPEKVSTNEKPALTKRWSSTLSSKVNLPHAINVWASCGANLVTRWSRWPRMRRALPE